jgi:general secretion pathway protein E
LRQDPNIILVGEIRDFETAEIAVKAALTGHLVLSTLHTNDAPSAITRLIDLGVAPFMINATLLGVMGQRLVRTLCPVCKKPAPMEEDTGTQWDELVVPWKAKRPAQIHQPEGCLECRMTGYKGRVGIYEILLMSPELRKLVTPTTDIAPLREQAFKEGMKPLRISGALKIANGITTMEEVLKVAPPASQP